MDSKRFIIIAAVCFSILFGSIYYFIFTNFVPVKEAATIYMNQVGLYKSSENANNVINTLKEHDIECFTMKKDDLLAVVCSLSNVREETIAQQATLAELGYTYIEKNIIIENLAIIDLLHDKNYTEALEMINNENQGNDNQ